MKLQLQKRKGTVAVIVAVCLSLLIGFAAISIDGGLVQHNRRNVQSASDAAALAAANDLFLNYPTHGGIDVPGTAVTKAKAVAAANGFNNDEVTNKVTVNIPPKSGLHVNKAGHAEVIIEYYQHRAFSRIWGSSSITINGRAVAAGHWSPFRMGILVLDPALPGALNNNGNGLMKVVNADVIDNSKAPDAAVATGSGTIVAPNFFITGDPGTSVSGSGKFDGNIFNKQSPTPDPLAYLDPPDKSTLTVQSSNSTQISGTKNVQLYPGIYKGGISVSGQASVTLNPGIYYMLDGGFSFAGQGNLTANGVMIYTDPKSTSDTVNVNGLGAINWSPMATGPYKGIALWQRRSSTNTVTMSGNGTSSITGTFYAQKGMLAVSGNGAKDVLGSQYISNTVNLGGNGNFDIDWKTDITARTRILRLVE
jgi:hypothetical protein